MGERIFNCVTIKNLGIMISMLTFLVGLWVTASDLQLVVLNERGIELRLMGVVFITFFSYFPYFILYKIVKVVKYPFFIVSIGLGLFIVDLALRASVALGIFYFGIFGLVSFSVFFVSVICVIWFFDRIFYLLATRLQIGKVVFSLPTKFKTKEIENINT
ncbi:MAG: hypothetical protein ABFQ53_00995 [Patescibacteria group bacterium]